SARMRPDSRISLEQASWVTSVRTRREDRSLHRRLILSQTLGGPDPNRRPPVRLLNVQCAPPILLTAGVIASIEACDAASVLDRCDRHVGRNRPGNAPISSPQQVMI